VRERLQAGRRGVGRHGPEAYRRRQQGRRLALVNVAQLGRRGRDVPAFALEVEHLAADEVAAARSQGEFADVVPDAVAGGGGRLGEDLEGDRQQGVSRQDGDALPILDVAGGPSPAEIVVVHAGEVVVHQRVGVDALDGGGGRER